VCEYEKDYVNVTTGVGAINLECEYENVYVNVTTGVVGAINLECEYENVHVNVTTGVVVINFCNRSWSNKLGMRI
jgi:hypothetical protein